MQCTKGKKVLSNTTTVRVTPSQGTMGLNSQVHKGTKVIVKITKSMGVNQMYSTAIYLSNREKHRDLNTFKMIKDKMHVTKRVEIPIQNRINLHHLE